METQLKRIGEKARKERDLTFTSLYHHVANVDLLRACFHELDGRKARGIDGVTKREYGERLDENLEDLAKRLNNHVYWPQPKRRTYIEKPGSAKRRPLSCFEDKIVELAVKKVLEPIYEADFLDCSYGYRPSRSPHDCLDALGRTIQRRKVDHVVEADIRAFFDEVNHEWLMKFLGVRVGDKRVLRLIRRMLEAGVMEDGLVRATIEGTPQGSILSPLLANIYLHYVLDLWFDARIKRKAGGEAYYFRYADDFLACFQRRADADDFLTRLNERLEGFNLRLAEEKTKRLSFGRFAKRNAAKRGRRPETFDFLGFTHYCGETRRGAFKVKRMTSRKKFRQALRNLTAWLREHRGRLRKGELIRGAKRRVTGHFQYYAVTDNFVRCAAFQRQTERRLFQAVNRKSQRKAYNWTGFRGALEHNAWPQLRIRVDLNPCRP